MAKSIEQLIDEANIRLRAGKTGLVIELRRNCLSLRGILPPKPGSDRTEPYQQRVPTGYRGNPAGIQLAEADARAVSAKLVRREFNWADHISIFVPETATVAELLERFEVDYCSRFSATSWRTYCAAAYKWLPQDQSLTSKEFIKVLNRHKQDTSSRQKSWNATNVLIKFANVEIDISSYRTTYSRKPLNSKDIPTDEEISYWHKKILNKQWQYAFGVFATYGLRNHELFYI